MWELFAARTCPPNYYVCNRDAPNRAQHRFLRECVVLPESHTVLCAVSREEWYGVLFCSRGIQSKPCMVFELTHTFTKVCINIRGADPEHVVMSPDVTVCIRIHGSHARHVPRQTITSDVLLPMSTPNDFPGIADQTCHWLTVKLVTDIPFYHTCQIRSPAGDRCYPNDTPTLPDGPRTEQLSRHT